MNARAAVAAATEAAEEAALAAEGEAGEPDRFVGTAAAADSAEPELKADPAPEEVEAEAEPVEFTESLLLIRANARFK